MLWVHIRIASFGEAILTSTHNICLYGEIAKIITKLSSYTLLICSSVVCMFFSFWMILTVFFESDFWDIYKLFEMPSEFPNI